MNSSTLKIPLNEVENDEEGICNPYFIITSYRNSHLPAKTFVKNLFEALEEADASLLDVKSEGKTLLYISIQQNMVIFVKEVLDNLKKNLNSLQEVLVQKWFHNNKWGNLIHILSFKPQFDNVVYGILDCFLDTPEIIDSLFEEKAWNKASGLQIAVQSRVNPEDFIRGVLLRTVNPLKLIKQKGAQGACLILYALHNHKRGVVELMKKYDETYVKCCIEVYKESLEWYDIEQFG